MNCAEHPGSETGQRYGHETDASLVARAEAALMAAHGCTPQVAAGILTGVARSAGTELRTVAETVAAVAESNAQAPPETVRAAITCALRNVLP
ncbi:ANTAR domain-containing protein [Streptomyces sp. Amel2xB2]|uniref:ANTAR domain-containing protein n=1 Tax=Streptomyces sp. Amel2xB2 TaxID=1305829 RepID=UPI000DBFF883|nr:ANTAR domain-containing protein [Streptomyces sp. Amel2xB2]RAJ71604.1 ANTAR domain-containing protein [Streptomyces sp. Amel2xB2]